MPGEFWERTRNARTTSANAVLRNVALRVGASDDKRVWLAYKLKVAIPTLGLPKKMGRHDRAFRAASLHMRNYDHVVFEPVLF